MEPLSLKVRTFHRASPDPLEDERLGEGLVTMVRGAVARRKAPAAAVVIRDERLDLLDVGEAARKGLDPRLLLAGLTRAEVPFASEVLAVGLIGRFQQRRGSEPGVPVAMAFLEWTDCRWWWWRALVDPRSGDLREDTETLYRAVDGDARPPGLGGWWSDGRRRGLRVRLDPKEPPLVH